MKKCVSPLALVLTISMLVVSYTKDVVQPSNTVGSSLTTSEHLEMGNPSSATTVVANPTHYLMVKPHMFFPTIGIEAFLIG